MLDDDAAAPERAARLVRMAAAPEDRITLTDEQARTIINPDAAS